MSTAIQTGEPVSIVVDKLLAEKMKDAKDSGRAKSGDKKGNRSGAPEGHLGVSGLVE